VVKKTRDKEYIQYLVKWKDHLLEGATWMKTSSISNLGRNIEELMDMSP